MDIKVTPKAAQWLQNELRLKPGDSLRLFAKYGGDSAVQPCFSLGMSVEPTYDIGASTVTNGWTLFVRDADLWFFDGHSLLVDLNPDDGDIQFNFLKAIAR